MSRFESPFDRVTDANGDPLAGALLDFFEAGTTTRKAVYSDIGLTTAHANPVVCDAGGLIPQIFLGSGSYKAVFSDSSGTVLSTIDNITSGLSDLSSIKSSVGNQSGTNYVDELRADFIRAGNLGIDTISHNLAGSTIYGWMTGQDGITVDLGENGSIQGINNLVADQRRMVGAHFYNPTKTVTSPFVTNNQFQRHQGALGFGLLKDDGTRDLIAQCHGHPTERKEGADGQDIFEAISSNAGASWGTPYNPVTDAAYCENPYDYTSIAGNTKNDRTLWRAGILNLQISGIADQIWSKWGISGVSTRNHLSFPVKTSPAGKWTNRQFFFHETTGVPLLTEDFVAPAGYSHRALFEGKSDYQPVCHDFIAMLDGRVLCCMVLVPPEGSSVKSYKKAAVLWTENPGESDPTNIVWKWGPSVPIGAFDPNNLWEWFIDGDKAVFRRNEKEAGSIEQVGRKEGVAFSNDGINWSAIQWTDNHGHRTRQHGRPVNHVWTAKVGLASPTGRAIGQIEWARRDGGNAQGTPFSTESLFSRTTDTFLPENSSDTIWPITGLTPRTEGNRFIHHRDGGDGEEVTLMSSGHLAATGADTLVLKGLDLTAADSAVITEGRNAVTLVPASAGQSIFTPGFQLSAAPQVFEIDAAGEYTQLNAGGFTWSSSTDDFTVYGGSTGVEEIFVEHASKRHVHAFASADDTLVSLGYDLNDTTDLAVALHEDGTFQEWIPPVDYTLKAGSAEATFFTALNGGDSVVMRQFDGDVLHVPTMGVDFEGNAIYAIWAYASTTVNPGVGGTDISVTKIAGPPVTDALVIFGNDNAKGYYGDTGHRSVYDGATNTFLLYGSAGAMSSLDRRALISIPEFQLSAAPSGLHPRPIVGIAGTNHFAELQIRTNGSEQTREVREIVGHGLELEDMTSVQKGKGIRVDDPTAVMGVQIFVEPEAGRVIIDGVEVNMPGPYSLYFGERLFRRESEDALSTSETLKFWIDGIKQTYVDANFMPRGYTPEDALTPNLFINPGFRLDPVRNGGNYTQASLNKTTVPPWVLLDDGGVTLRISRNTFSTSAASSRRGWQHAMTVSLQSTKLDDFVKLAHPWRGMQSVMGPVFFTGLFENVYNYEGEGLAAPDDGILVNLECLQRPADSETIRKTRLLSFRVFPERRRIEESLVIPDPNISLSRTINKSQDWCAFQLSIETTHLCSIRLEEFDIYRGNGPRDWTPPTVTEDEEKLAPYWQCKRLRKVNETALITDYRAAAATAHWLWDLAPPMAQTPRLVTNGSFKGLNAGGTIPDVKLDTITVDPERIVGSVSGVAAINTMDEVVVRASSSEVFEFTADGSQSVFTIPERVGTLVSGTGNVTVFQNTGGGTLTLTGGSIDPGGTVNDFIESEAFDVFRDGPFTGDGAITTWTQNYSIGTSSQVDVLKGSGNQTVAETLTPLTDYSIVAGDPGTLVLTSPLASGDLVRTQHRTREHEGHFITIIDPPAAGDIITLVPASASDCWIAADGYVFESDTA